MIEQRHRTQDPTDSATLVVMTDDRLAEVGMALDNLTDGAEVALSVAQVGEIVVQLTGWLARRAR